jgi:hypothetical protein
LAGRAHIHGDGGVEQPQITDAGRTAAVGRVDSICNPAVVTICPLSDGPVESADRFRFRFRYVLHPFAAKYSHWMWH